ncbi:MAG: N-acetylmuramoyl-L-alanine amidase [Thermoanaerobaculia bacterium]
MRWLRTTVVLTIWVVHPECMTAADFRASLADGTFAVVTESNELYLEAYPRKGEGWLRFAERLCGSSRPAAALAKLNGGSAKVLSGVRYRVPYALLSPKYQLQVARKLFAFDRPVHGGWEHRVAQAGEMGSESLWRVARWFTGKGENYAAIRQHNQLADDHLEPGDTLVIPTALLLPAFHAVIPPSSPYHLEYKRDDENRAYAEYKLQTGEALYSSVVVRFTGLIYADDVNALAAEVADLSEIDDVTNIPVGFAVRIPLDRLLPEFLPFGDARRKEYEEGLLASGQFSNQVKAARLDGVTIILDAGHGGTDVGASVDGIWESVYVYDIMERVKRLLRHTTSASVYATTRDGSGVHLGDQDKLPNSRRHEVLTTPTYPIKDSTVGVHLRWYLANSLFRQASRQGTDPAKVIFLSIHADSLHKSLRGAMAYIPDAGLRSGSFGKSGAVYSSRKEYQDGPRVNFSKRDLIKSEGLSRDLARHLLSSFDDHELAVHPFKPIREKVIRGRRAWVPAVLRYNSVPAAILLEVCNLANTEDRGLLETRDFRDRVAETIVVGILRYYDDSIPDDPEFRIASAGG